MSVVPVDRSAALPPALTIDALSRAYGGLQALSDVSFSVPQGVIFGVMGPNGAGKTTLLNIISGLDVPSSGSTSIRGHDSTAMPAHRIAGLDVARTFQNVRLFEGLSILDNIVSGMYRRRRAPLLKSVCLPRSSRRESRAVRDRAVQLMNRVGLSSDLDQPADTLPYGHQRRVELARALASEPTLLLLDEPTAGMNRVESKALEELLLSLREDGITIVVIEHNMQLMLAICETAIVMNFGKVLAEGPPRKCVELQAVREAYFGRRSDAELVESLLQLRGD